MARSEAPKVRLTYGRISENEAIKDMLTIKECGGHEAAVWAADMIEILLINSAGKAPHWTQFDCSKQVSAVAWKRRFGDFWYFVRIERLESASCTHKLWAQDMIRGGRAARLGETGHHGY